MVVLYSNNNNEHKFFKNGIVVNDKSTVAGVQGKHVFLLSGHCGNMGNSVWSEYLTRRVEWESGTCNY